MNPEDYKGKEQTYIKHTLLNNYLYRLFMIIGQYEGRVKNLGAENMKKRKTLFVNYKANDNNGEFLKKIK
jgi:hypothetical protein